jgi:eukaryotic-like serine/threonine-protein kinase
MTVVLGGGRFELLVRIGRGATGEVFRARDRGGGVVRDVCIKRLAGDFVGEHDLGLREEARLLASIRHANVVSLLALGEDDGGGPFLVLELIDGLDLKTLTRRLETLDDDVRPESPGQVPDHVAIHIACAVLRALAAVQRAVPGLVHRDVTPHNILVSNEGEVKLSDFGIALALDRMRRTGPCIVKGKLGYMAPEQFHGEPLDGRTDIFAVGVVLYELLTKLRPWRGRRGMDELRAMDAGESVPLLERRSDLGRDVAAVVERLLAIRKGDRFASADDALRALAPFGAGDLGSLRLASLIATVVESPDRNGERARSEG